MFNAHTRTPLVLALAGALSLGAAASGCSDHDHDHAASETPRTAILKEQQAAADAIVSQTRLYVEGRERNPSAPLSPHADIGPRDAALDALFEAAKADRACDLADKIAEGAMLDPGREARLRSSADLVRRIVAVIVKQSSALAASGQGQPTLKIDLDHLRASLRALKVELYAIQAQVDSE